MSVTVTDEIEALREELAELREENKDLRQELKEHKQHAGKDRANIRGHVNRSIEEATETLGEQIREEQKKRGKEDGKLARRLSIVEDELGIDATDAAAIGDGGSEAIHLTKLQRFLRHGPEAVVDRVYPVHERAREIGLNVGKWGNTINDSYGKRVVLCSKKDEVKVKLEAQRDEKLQWGEVYRAMEKLEDIAEGKVRLTEGKKDQGKYVLEIRQE